MVFGAFGIIEDDEDEVRPFPPAATPVRFPKYRSFAPHIRDIRRPEELHKRLAKLTKLTDVNAEDIADLNPLITQGLSLEKIIPRDARGQSYMPPPQWDFKPKDDSMGPEQSIRSLYTGDSAPDRKMYFERKCELDHDNFDAYRGIHRQPSEKGGKILNVGNHFKFWAALEQVSRYWDTSRDTEEEIRGKANPPRPSKPDGDSAMDIDTPPKQEKGYMGQRFGTGKDVPASYLENCVKFFVETVAWLFRCQVQAPRGRPRLALGTSQIPVPLSHNVLKVPADLALAKAGGVEGPLAGIFCRPYSQLPDTSISSEESQSDRVDLLQELMIMLFLAQERRREGKPDVRSGEGKWYTTVPRWGGFCDVETESKGSGNTNNLPTSNKAITSSSSASLAAGEDEAIQAKDHIKNRLRNYRRTSRASGIQQQKNRVNPMKAWNELRASSSLRDPNIKYQAIGKTRGSDLDDIFLFSAMNHHLSVVRLRVSEKYMSFLETGKVPSSSSASDTSAQQWDELDMVRSRWYDLFDREDRKEIMRGVWGVMAFLTRSMDDDDDGDDNDNEGDDDGKSEDTEL